MNSYSFSSYVLTGDTGIPLLPSLSPVWYNEATHPSWLKDRFCRNPRPVFHGSIRCFQKAQSHPSVSPEDAQVPDPDWQY